MLFRSILVTRHTVRTSARGLHTSSTLLAQTKGKAPLSSRKPVESIPRESQQSGHLHHKSDPSSPDSGEGSAADTPSLPSHTLSGDEITSPQQATPDLYLKDDSLLQSTGGITEDEGSGDQGVGSGHMYVVAEGAPSEKFYDVPSGAYSSIDTPYDPLPTTDAPEKVPGSSTSPQPAHPALSKRAATFREGVGSSASVGFKASPGKMSAGGDGGLGLHKNVKATENTLDERNPGPTAEMGRQGIHEAWKHRK